MRKTLQEKDLARAALEIRKNLLKLCSRESIHIGGDLSIADVMTVLWQYQMRYNPRNPKDERRDRFVLSKGHASAVAAFCQAATGCFSPEEIVSNYASDQGRFSMHPCALANPFVEVSTGSLGHGMPVACGMAAGLRLKGNQTSRVYTVMGDGEHGEGSVWEAVMNAARYRLGNLVVMVDCNNLAADGFLSDLTGLGNLPDAYRAFGWNVLELNGNDVRAVKQAFDALPDAASDVPSVLICRTVKGKGVLFMENQVRWHAGRISELQYAECVAGLEKAFAEQWGGDGE